jgi:hypothetical protein
LRFRPQQQFLRETRVVGAVAFAVFEAEFVE